jgi:hypothetical protein
MRRKEGGRKERWDDKAECRYGGMMKQWSVEVAFFFRQKYAFPLVQMREKCAVVSRWKIPEATKCRANKERERERKRKRLAFP